MTEVPPSSAGPDPSTAATTGPTSDSTALRLTAPRPTALAPLHLRLFALLFDYAVIVSGVKLAEQVLLGEHWDLRPLAAATGWRALATPWQALMLALLLVRDAPGWSVGKWLTGLAVRRADDPERKAGLRARLLRNVSLVLLPVDAWLVFSDRYGRRLGERWAGTVVVQHPRPPDLFQRAMGLGALFLGFILAALLITSWNLHRSAAFQTAYAVAAQDAALANQVGQPLKVDRAPELELQFPGAGNPLAPAPASPAPAPDATNPAGRAASTAMAAATATATFDASGPKGRAKLRVELALVPGAAGEAPRWQVARTEVLDALGGPLTQKEAPQPK